MPGGTRRTKAEYEALLAECAASGTRLTVFAQRKGVPYSTLAMWRKRLRGSAGASAEPVTRPKTPARRRAAKPRRGPATTPANGTTTLLPVELALEASKNGAGRSREPIEILLRSGHMLRVPPRFDADDVRRLLELLASSAC